jgi:PleD family two-component response regulator
VADKIRDAVAKHEFMGTLADGGVRVTVSVGIAVATDDFKVCEDFVAAAESALGESIAAGFNQVVLYSAPESADDEEAGPYSLAS